MKRVPSVICLILLLLLAGGCAQYQPLANEEPIRIALAPIINESEIPQIIAPLARNLREKLAHDRRWILVEEPEAERVLHLRILSLSRRPMARDPSDTGRPLSFREVVRAALSWEGPLELASEEDAPLIIESDILLYGQPSLIRSETAAAARIAEDLAQKIQTRINRPVYASPP